MNSQGVNAVGWEEAPGAAASYGPDRGSHIPALDAIRGLAILMVTAFRFGSHGDDLSPLGRVTFALLGQGHRGVDLFFVLSGFLITGILYDAKSGPRYFRNFYARRTLRIFPLYYGFLFVMLVLLPWFAPSLASLYQESIKQQTWLWLYGSNLLLAWKDAWVLPGFNHFWSLAIEEHFYLIWPLVIFLCTRRQGMLVCAACVIGAPCLRIYLLLLGNSQVTVEVLTLCRLDSLAVGGFLALAARGQTGARALVPWSWAAAGAAGLAFVAMRWFAGNTWSLTYTFFALLFGALILVGVTTDPSSAAGRLWNSPFLRSCGKYSYGWYVFQGALAPCLRTLFTADDLGLWVGSAFLGRLLYVLWGAVLFLALSLLSWHLYEKHFLKLKEVLARKERERRAIPAAPGPSA